MQKSVLTTYSYLYIGVFKSKILSKCASGHILCPNKDFYVAYLSNDLGGGGRGNCLHFISSSIRRAIVWMPSAWVVMYGSNYLYVLVSGELWEHDRPTIGVGESSCGCSHTYMFDHVFVRVLKCGYLWRVAVILEYMHQGMYVWKYLVYCLFSMLFGKIIGLKWIFLQVH